MIEDVDLQNPGSFAQPASQPDISFARCRIPGYAASGITGVMPYADLRRTEHGVPPDEALSDAA